MAMRMRRLVYESRATGSTGSLLNLAAILSEAQRNNDRDGVTGALAAHGERYIQVLEGEADILEGLLRRLNRDSRHRDVRIIDRGPITERAFSGWAMANARISPSQAPALDALMAAERPSGPRIVALLKDSLGAGPVTA